MLTISRGDKFVKRFGIWTRTIAAYQGSRLALSLWDLKYVWIAKLLEANSAIQVEDLTEQADMTHHFMWTLELAVLHVSDVWRLMFGGGGVPKRVWPTGLVPIKGVHGFHSLSFISFFGIVKVINRFPRFVLFDAISYFRDFGQDKQDKTAMKLVIILVKRWLRLSNWQCQHLELKHLAFRFEFCCTPLRCSLLFPIGWVSTVGSRGRGSKIQSQMLPRAMDSYCFSLAGCTFHCGEWFVPFLATSQATNKNSLYKSHCKIAIYIGYEFLEDRHMRYTEKQQTCTFCSTETC